MWTPFCTLLVLDGLVSRNYSMFLYRSLFYWRILDGWMSLILLSEVLGWMLGVGRPVTWRINGRGGCEPQVAHGARRLSDSEVPGLHTRPRPRPEPALPGATVAPCTPHLTSTKRFTPKDLHQETSTKRPPPRDFHQKSSAKRPPPKDLHQKTSSK